jgi:hypothetical protein
MLPQVYRNGSDNRAFGELTSMNDEIFCLHFLRVEPALGVKKSLKQP